MFRPDAPDQGPSAQSGPTPRTGDIADPSHVPTVQSGSPLVAGRVPHTATFASEAGSTGACLARLWPGTARTGGGGALHVASGSAVGPALGGLIALAVGIGIGRFVYTPILPPMLATLGLSKAAAGLIASANFAGYLAGALGATRHLAGSRRLWLLGALLLSAATTAAMGFTVSVPAFLALRFAGGVASALVLILASALVLERLAEAGRPALAPLHFAGVGVGIAVSAALVAFLLSHGGDWASMWRVSGAASLLGALAVAALVPDEPPLPASGAPAVGRTAGDPRLRRMVLAYGLFGFGYVITATFLVAIVRATPSIRVLEPVIWILVGVAAAPSVLLWSWLGRRIGIPAAFAIAALAEAAGVLASVFWPGMVGICLAAVLVGGTFMGLTALGLMHGRELAREIPGADPRRVMAAMTGAFGMGQIVGPALAGVVSDATGGFAVPSVAAAVALVAAARLGRR
jgi:predicted MFS family arabinose efflux permease